MKLPKLVSALKDRSRQRRERKRHRTREREAARSSSRTGPTDQFGGPGGGFGG
jgi:hypothetical protein